jgi:lipid-A-disaccharide synthase
VLKIKQIVDRLFCIFPFEVDFYKAWGMDVDYVGNPLLDAIATNEIDPLFKIKHKIGYKPIIALLPGSRKQELKRILPDMIQVSDYFPAYQFVIAGAPTYHLEDYQPFIGGRKISVIFNETYNLLLYAQAAIVTSGTATLETALLKIPQVVVYKGHSISVGIARKLVSIQFISLVNLVMNNEVVKELIQEDCNPTSIQTELKRILHDPSYRKRMLTNYDQLAERMGKAGASAKAAKLMHGYLLGA